MSAEGAHADETEFEAGTEAGYTVDESVVGVEYVAGP